MESRKKEISLMAQSDVTDPRRRWMFSVGILLVLAAVSWIHSILASFAAYRSFHRDYPYYFAESIDKIGGVVVCVVAIWLLRRARWKDIACELGLAKSFLPGIAFGFAVTLPLLVGFALANKITPHMNVVEILFLAVLSSIVEEIEFRGLGVLVFRRGTGWPFWVVVWPQALLFGLGHIEKGQNMVEMAGLLLLTGTGGVLFAWLAYRWQSLWFPLSVHILTNLWWAVFSVSDTALAGRFAFALQLTSIVTAIAITLRWSRRSVQDKSGIEALEPGF
jgi:membrane protease YdiL (CAAX protease family)